MENEKRLAACGIPRQPIGEIALRCNCGATPVGVEYDGQGQGLIRTSDVRPNRFEAGKVMRTTALNVARDDATAAIADDLVFTMSGTIGYAAVIPRTPEVFSFSNTIARVRFAPDGASDPRFVAAFFNCKYGYTQSLRLTSGGIQGHVMPNPFRRLLVPMPSPLAQKYIGNKVRQAEELRRAAQQIQQRIDRILSLDPIQSAMAMADRSTNRVHPGDLTSRLDGKFYAARAMRVFEATVGCDGVPIRELDPDVSNGFECRSFVEDGQAYVTVTQVRGRRLDLTDVPKIPNSVAVPARARLTERTVLAVRSGATIGTVVKAQAEDSHASVSSHFIILRFKSESVGAAVATFLNSQIGRCLQDKIVYGGVIPQISQEDLLSLPIPKAILDAADEIADLANARENSLRSAERLALLAKLLVDALIDLSVSEDELEAAQQSLDNGDSSLDHRLLSRFRANGLDEESAPLFPDIDVLDRLVDSRPPYTSSNGDAA